MKQMSNDVLIDEYRYAISVATEHFSTSAKTGEGILDLFANLAKSIDYICVITIGILNVKKR